MGKRKNSRFLQPHGGRPFRLRDIVGSVAPQLFNQKKLFVVFLVDSFACIMRKTAPVVWLPESKGFASLRDFRLFLYEMTRSFRAVVFNNRKTPTTNFCSVIWKHFISCLFLSSGEWLGVSKGFVKSGQRLAPKNSLLNMHVSGAEGFSKGWTLARLIALEEMVSHTTQYACSTSWTRFCSGWMVQTVTLIVFLLCLWGNWEGFH